MKDCDNENTVQEQNINTANESIHKQRYKSRYLEVNKGVSGHTAAVINTFASSTS